MENPHFSDVFTVKAASNANPFPELHIAHGTSHSVHVLVDRANKRLSENLGIAGRKQGGILDAHLPFIGNAKMKITNRSVPLSKFLVSLYVHFFSIYCNLPSIKAPFLFLCSPCLRTGYLILFLCAGGWQRTAAAAHSGCREGSSAQHQASGAN